jgi:catechol-2,3-dioxygenase
MLEDVRMTAVLPVKDLAKARTFWEKMIGLIPNRVEEDDEGVMYLSNNTALFIYQTEATQGDATKVVFVVDDVVKEMNDLKAHGVVFADFDLPGLKTVDGVADRAGRKTAWFTDLEGNYIALTELM